MQELTKAQCREADRRAVEEYGIASIVLMENAGRGTVDVMYSLAKDGISHMLGHPSVTTFDNTISERMNVSPFRSGPVVVLCGKGNNAGDGFVVARHLDIRGVEVRVMLLADPSDLRGDALVNYDILTKTDVTIFHSPVPNDLHAWFDQHAGGASWLVDALLGTGATGPPRPPFDAAIEWFNNQPASTKKLAVDVPSGLDCDSGEAPGACIQADYTCTFVAMKCGFLEADANSYTGQVHVLDIGAPRKLVEDV